MFITDLMPSPDEITYAWLGAITKVERDVTDPSVRYVYGKATDDTLDSDEQIVDPEWARKAMADWFSTAANVRQMHSTTLAPAGKGMILDSTKQGEFVKTKVVEPTAIVLVDHDVYTGYSVGIARPRIIRDARARGGRIVGGRIVELSLVDRPANPQAKFQVATKRATDDGVEFTGKVMAADLTKGFSHTHTHFGPSGTPHKHEHMHATGTVAHDELHEGGAHAHSHTEAVVADDQQAPVADDAAAKADDASTEPVAADAAKADGSECDKCHGEGKVDGATCDKCHGEGVLTKADTADADADAPDEPPADAKKLAKAARRVAKATKADEPAKDPDAKDEGAEDAAAPDEPEPGADAATKGEVPWLVRRAHDLTCPAYATPDVIEVYPSIEKNGVAATLGPTARQAVFAMLQQELGEDAGSGSDALAIKCLAKAYWSIEEFLQSETSEPVPDAVYLAARDDLHAAFKAANGAELENGTGGLPKPSTTITPGQFRRPYLAADHAREGAAASAPRIPTTTHPIDGSDFTRGPLADGHQRTLTSKLTDLHDALSEWHPELCLMDANGSMAFDRQPPNPVTTQLDNREGASPQPISLPDAIVVPGGEPSFKTVSEEEIAAVVTKITEPLLTKITTIETDHAKLKEDYEALASSGDPAQTAHRGVRTPVSRPDVTKVQDKSARKRSEKADFMHSLARSGDPAQRTRALDWLGRHNIDYES